MIRQRQFNAEVQARIMAANNGVPYEEELESVALLNAIETEIIDKCRQAPNSAINMAKLLGSKQQQLGMPGIYLLAATNLCSQGKVRLQQEAHPLAKVPCSLDNMIITLI